MKAKVGLVLLCVIFSSIAFGQVNQVIRGRVLDNISRTALPGAAVILKGDSDHGTVTDTTGSFRIENVPAGRYRLEIQFLGYKPHIIKDLLVNAGKEVNLTVELQEDPRNLEEVVVRGSDVINDLDVVSRRTFTVEETQRFAASFYDPARLVTAYPGVVTANDQTNNISIRGYSPNSLRWWLQGAEIVNPNHTSNAGTLADKPTTNGGGVNILSAQMLGNSDFITGGFSPRYSNVMSGVLDMNLRTGNNSDHEFVAQASLLGLDFAAEGPFSRNSKSSFLVNYRYSTVGILSALGVDFGGEEISFQDLSFNLTLPLKKGSINLFGVGGLSHNYFSGARDSSEWEDAKSSRDIDFNSRMGAAGISLNTSISKSGSVYGTLVWSGLENTRFASQLNPAGNLLTPIQSYVGAESKTALNVGLRNKLGTLAELDLGAHLVRHQFSIDDQDGNTQLIQGDEANTRLAPYLEFRSLFPSRFNMSIGTQVIYYSLARETVFEPRVTVSYAVGKRSDIRISYGLYSQEQLPETLLRVTAAENNLELLSMKSHQFVAGFYTLLGNWSVQAETYYHSLYDLAVEDEAGSTFSVVNDMVVYRPLTFSNAGTGEHYGADISLERLFSNGYYGIFSGSLYESTYQAADGIQRDTRYNTNYAFNLSGGKEFTSQKKPRTIGINGRFYYIGGLRDTPIDTQASMVSGRTIYDESQAYSLQNAPYIRFDLRLSTTKQKPNYTRMIALDIQNILNRQNKAFRYYDAFLNEVVIQKQLGIIPVLTYRVEF